MTLRLRSAALDDVQIAHRWPFAAHGHVTDDSGRPIAGAEVTAAGIFSRLTGRTMTDAQGNYTLKFGSGFVNEDMPPIAITIAAAKPGRYDSGTAGHGRFSVCRKLPPENQREDVRYVLPGQAVKLDFELLPAASLSGQIVAADGRPLAEAKTSLRGQLGAPSPPQPLAGQTDGGGRFELPIVPLARPFWFVVETGKDQYVRSMPICVREPAAYRAAPLAPRRADRRRPARSGERHRRPGTQRDGGRRRGRSTRATSPARGPARGRGEIVARLLAANRYWLEDEPPGVEDYQFDFQFDDLVDWPRQTYVIHEGKGIARYSLHGITYRSAIPRWPTPITWSIGPSKSRRSRPCWPSP